jgi:hypothetical protein
VGGVDQFKYRDRKHKASKEYLGKDGDGQSVKKVILDRRLSDLFIGHTRP